MKYTCLSVIPALGRFGKTINSGLAFLTLLSFRAASAIRDLVSKNKKVNHLSRFLESICLHDMSEKFNKVESVKLCRYDRVKCSSYSFLNMFSHLFIIGQEKNRVTLLWRKSFPLFSRYNYVYKNFIKLKVGIEKKMIDSVTYLGA